MERGSTLLHVISFFPGIFLKLGAGVFTFTQNNPDLRKLQEF